MCAAIMQSFVFFFFQAEDGIRDLTVTGVQTCALPISSRTSGPGPQSASEPVSNDCCKSTRGSCTAPSAASARAARTRSEEHTSELQSQSNLVCRLLLEKKKKQEQHSKSPDSCQH